MRCCGRGAADGVADAAVVEPVRAGTLGATGNASSAASTATYHPHNGGDSDGWKVPTSSGSPLQKPTPAKGELPSPLDKLKALLDGDQLPLLPGFLLEKAENMTLQEAHDLGTLLSRVPPSDIAPDQEVPVFLLMQALITRLLEGLNVEGSVEKQRWRESCATGVRHALQMMQEMEHQLADEKARRVQAESDCSVLLASLRRTGKPAERNQQQSLTPNGVGGRASIWQRSTTVPLEGWSHWDLPRLNAAATRIQRLHRGKAGRRRFEQHAKLVLRAVDPAFDPELTGVGRRRASTRAAASVSGYSEVQMASVLRRHCHDLEAKYKAASQTLEVIREEVKELMSSNDALRETNTQLEGMSKLRAELSCEKEASRLLRKECAALRKELNALRPDADQGGARQRSWMPGLTLVTSSGGASATGGSGDGNTEVDEWASLPSMPSSPLMAEFGGPKRSAYPRGHEPMPAAQLQASIDLPVSLQQQLPPFPKSPNNSPART